jgi:hypothetical protein
MPAARQKLHAQQLSPTLQQLTQKSGFIFSGTVLAVERASGGKPGEMPTVRITFRVDQAVRGVKAKQIFSLHEWAGLWETGDRYRVGESVFLFLYPNSRLGMSSPVGGSLGRFPLDNRGQILLRQEQLAALRAGLTGPSSRASQATAVDTRAFVRAIQRLSEAPR